MRNLGDQDTWPSVRGQTVADVPVSHDALATDDALGMPIVHALRAVTVGLNLFAARFAQDNGLHPTDLRAIINLLDAEREGLPATPGWLGESLRLNSASVTALVDRLERLGHVRRERDPSDRRRVLLTVTPEAKAVGWAFFGPLMARLLDTMREYREDELTVIHRFLTGTAAVVSGGPSFAA
jgi:DNA-binding MarR family transcriptional regulator